MNYGITGHQERDGIDWEWVRAKIGEKVRAGGSTPHGLSSLARGADQVFAEEVLRAGGELTAVIPIDGYEAYFEGDALVAYRQLLAASRVEHMPAAEDDEAAFLAAGLRVADECEVLLAVWDGEGAHGSGGTADIVAHAKAIGRTVIHLQPISREIATLSP